MGIVLVLCIATPQKKKKRRKKKAEPWAEEISNEKTGAILQHQPRQRKVLSRSRFPYAHLKLGPTEN